MDGCIVDMSCLHAVEGDWRKGERGDEMNTNYSLTHLITFVACLFAT